MTLVIPRVASCYAPPEINNREREDAVMGDRTAMKRRGLIDAGGNIGFMRHGHGFAYPALISRSCNAT